MAEFTKGLSLTNMRKSDFLLESANSRYLKPAALKSHTASYHPHMKPGASLRDPGTCTIKFILMLSYVVFFAVILFYKNLCYKKIEAKISEVLKIC